MIHFLILAAVSPWLANVYEYCPAPGQFINEVPEIAHGASREQVLQSVAEQITGGPQNGLVSLGAFGGYVTVGFDHTVVNLPGENDFKIYGNSMTTGGEAGIILVSRDTNGNGLPDDPWYELTGSAEADARPGCTITYRRPSERPDPPRHDTWKFVTDAEYIPWEDNQGASGYLMKISNHMQSYWPEWTDAESLTFSGTCLPATSADLNGKGTSIQVTNFDWGYADNLPNPQETGFDIGRAVDAERNPVYLDGADFIRIHTGVNEFRGWLGECSTEIAGGEDLHPGAQLANVAAPTAPKPISGARIKGNVLYVRAYENAELTVSDLNGRNIAAARLEKGDNTVELPAAVSGILTVRAGSQTLKCVCRQ